MLKDDIFKLCMESKNGAILIEKNFKKNFYECYLEVLEYVKEEIPFVQKLYNYFHDIREVPLTPCGKKKVFRNFRHGYNDFCGANCECMVKSGNIKRKKTCLDRYGVEYATQTDEIKNKISETKLNYTEDRKNEIRKKRLDTVKEKYGDSLGDLISRGVMEKYGVKNVTQVKEIAEKVKQSNIRNHGGVGFASETVREKINETCIERYGDAHYTNMEKRKKTNIEKYGDEFPIRSEIVKDKIRNTNLERYGVEVAVKNEDVRKRLSESVKRYKNKNTTLQHDDIIEVRENTFVVKCNDDCVCGGSYEIPKHIYFQRNAVGVDKCVVRNPIRVKGEMENGFVNYVRSIYDGEIVIHNRKILSGKEIDLYLPGLNIGFEFNGDYWHHNPLFSKYNDDGAAESWTHDMEKQHYAFLAGISLYQIWEFEWTEYTEETKLYLKKIIDGKIQKQYPYDKLRVFIDELGGFVETSFGVFETDNVIVRYSEGFYCGRNAIDKEWFINSSKRVIYVYDFEINDERKFSVIQSLIRHAVGKTERRLFARKCELHEIDNKTAKPFLDENSLFGHRNANVTLGLYYEGELIMVYSFGHNFYGRKKRIEVIRVCTKKNTVVVGGSSKCLKYYVDSHRDEIEKYGMVFYVDKIHQDGRLLDYFKFVRHSYGFMNYWNMDYDDGDMKGERGTAFNRMPSKHKLISELGNRHILSHVLTIGVDLYEFDINLMTNL